MSSQTPQRTAVATHGSRRGTGASGSTRYPVLGILATSAGTLAALALIPEDPEPRGALFNSALAMAVGLSIAPMAAALRDPKALLRGEHLLSLAPVYWLLLDPLQSVYGFESIAPEQVRTAFIGIGLFVTGVWIGALAKPWRIPAAVVRSVSVEFPAAVYFRLAALAFLIAMLKYAVPTDFNIFEMYRYVWQGRWDAPWGRGQLGGWDSFLDHFQYFGYLLPTLTVIVARRAGWLDPRTLVSSSMSLIMALFLAQGGGRRIIGVIFGMALVLWMLTQSRLKPRHMAVVAGAVVILLAVFQTMLAYRNVGLGAVLDAESASEPRDYLHVDDNIYRFCQIIQLIPESYPYVYHQYVVWVLVRPIPRIFWPGKPVDPGFDLPAALGTTGVSYSYSTVGELYMSAGLVGILAGGWLYGRLAGMGTRLLTQNPTTGGYVVYSTLMMALFSGVRSMLELVLVSYVVLAWAGLSHIVARSSLRPPDPRESRVLNRRGGAGRRCMPRAGPAWRG